MLNLKTPQVNIILISLIPLCLKLFLNSFLATPGSFMIREKKGIEMWTLRHAFFSTVRRYRK